MTISNEIKVTSEILWKGALSFALIDIVFVAALIKLVKPHDLQMMKWKLVIFIAFFFTLLFGILVSVVFWDSVYSYVFPEWARWIIPPSYGILFSSVGLLFWWIAFRLPANAVRNFCLLGGLWGMTSHIWAIHRGILEKPPMLQGAGPVPAVVIAIFEFIFYWCVCLAFTSFIYHFRSRSG
jgi:hypothetical protein